MRSFARLARLVGHHAERCLLRGNFLRLWAIYLLLHINKFFVGNELVLGHLQLLVVPADQFSVFQQLILLLQVVRDDDVLFFLAALLREALLRK